jgi:uncharacterized protein (DUF2147 family)
MLKSAIIISLLFFIGVSSPAVKSDDILGIWTTGNAKSQVQIYKIGEKFFGKIIKLKDPLNEQGKPKVDFRNSDASKRNMPLIGLNVLRDLVFDKDEWNGGRIYNPEDGKDYKCLMRLKDAKTLEVRGYIGFSLIGKSQTWTR